MVLYKCLTSPQKTIRVLRHDMVKKGYPKKRQDIYPWNWNTTETQSIPANHARHLGQHFNHDSYKQEVKTSQHTQWQKIPIKVSFFLHFNPCNFLILPLLLTASNFLTLQIYHWLIVSKWFVVFCPFWFIEENPPIQQNGKPKSHGHSSIQSRQKTWKITRRREYSRSLLQNQ